MKRTWFVSTTVVFLALVLITAPAARGDHVLSPAPTRVVDPTNQAGASFGNAVAVGDLNGDGMDDMVVGADNWSGDIAAEGRIYAFLRTADGWDRVASRISHPTDQTGSLFGFSLAAAGDVDGDGYDDVVVGAPEWNDGTTNDAGRAYMYRGGPVGLRLTSWTPSGTGVVGRFGWSVASAGDVNADGYDDVAVGCLNCDGSADGEGAVLLYLGSSGGLATQPTTIAEPADQFAAAFGGSVSFSDVNGDGYSDLIAGAWGWNGPGITAEGRAYAFYGSATGLETAPSWMADPTDQAFANFGRSVSSAGDVDNDGYGDVAVAAPLWDGDAQQQGRVWIYRGSATGLTEGWSRRGPRIGFSGYGIGLGPGDVNGDGFGDLLVGADTWGRRFGAEGRVLVYLGSNDGPLRLTDFPGHPTDQPASYFGHAVAAFSDGGIVIGAFYADDEAVNEGAIYLFEPMG